MKVGDWIAAVSAIVSVAAVAISVIVYSNLGASELEKIRVESSADFCTRILTDHTATKLYETFRSREIFEKAKSRKIEENSTDTRLIGDYLNILQSGAILVEGLGIRKSKAATTIFVECTCSQYDTANRYYLATVDQSAYGRLKNLLDENDFWTSSTACAEVWNNRS